MPKPKKSPKGTLSKGIEAIEVKRRLARERFTVLYQEFRTETAKGEQEMDLMVLKGLRDMFEKLRMDFERYDEFIQQNLEGAPLVAEIEEAEEITYTLNTAQIAVVNLLEELERRKTALELSDRVSVNDSQQSFGTRTDKKVTPKLPKLQIQNFDGDPMQYQSFWDQFESAIHLNNELSNVDKFNYLRSLLKDNALRAIDGIAITNANYQNAIELIKERFGGAATIRAAHFERILNLPPINSKKTTELRGFLDHIEKHIRSLTALGVKENTYSEALVPMILGKLPYDVKLELNRKKGTVPWDLSTLRTLLKEEVIAREQAIESESTEPKDKIMYDKPFKRDYAANSKVSQIKTTSTLVSSTTTKSPSQRKCSYCSELTHYSDECKTYSDVVSRRKRLSNRCFVCLRNGHDSRSCTAPIKCIYCGKRHHRSLCPSKFGTNPNSGDSEQTATPKTTATVTRTMAMMTTNAGNSVTLLAPMQNVIMPTAIATVESSENSKPRSTPCRLILDSGSHRSYITEDIAKRLKLSPLGYQVLEVGTFGSDLTSTVRSIINKIKIKLSNNSAIELTVNVVPTISIPIQKAEIDIEKYGFIKNLTLAEPLCDLNGDVKLDMLIGSDYYNDLVGEKRIEVDKGLYLTDSVFGWVLSGRIDSPALNEQSSVLIAPLRNNQNLPIDAALEKFWKIEAVGICDDGQIKDDDVAIKKFNDSIKFQNGRYQVSWPWKEPEPELPENYELALGRLKSLQRRLEQQPEVHENYSRIIEKQEEEGIIERVVPNISEGSRKHYLPHHVVSKKDSASTKLRIVYDASAKQRKNTNSLNDCLYRGPVLIENLLGLLMRFRSYPIGILSDIEKAFLQIALNVEDRDVTRFLWYDKDKNLQIYRFCRVPFGIVSSPFLLEAIVAYHLQLDGSKTAQMIRKNIYVDNVCVGVDTVEEGIELYTSSKNIFNAASMNLRQWYSNSADLMRYIPSDDHMSGEKTKVLGLTWRRHSDTLEPLHCNLTIEGTVTKRKMLASIAQIYDPLGLFAPVVLRAKLAIQNLWKMNLDWDSPVSSSVEREWQELLANIQGIDKITVERFVGIQNNLQHESVTVEIHCFCDSSASAYAAAVYLRIIQNGKITTRLVLSKTRLAPIRTLTIPRLELLAVLIGTRLIQFVETQMAIVPTRKFLWSDSKCVLAWIHNKKLKAAFVENRLKEIRQSETTQFRYVPTTQNPADVATRGMSAFELKGFSLWWEGPNWLKDGTVDSWPAVEVTSSDEERRFDELENRITSLNSALVTTEISDDALTSLLRKCSSLKKLLHITVFIFRAKNKFKKCKVSTGTLSVEELASAQRFWNERVQKEHFSEEIKLLSKGQFNGLIKQLNLYIDDNGLIRCRGRLKFSEIVESAKNPILLPKGHCYTSLIIKNLHEKLLHAGTRHILSELRQTYWIPSARRCIQTVLKNCVICRKWEGGPFQPPPAPALPKERLAEAPPFTFIGLDFLGPMWIRQEKGDASKIWICLFTCAVTRAVHLELVPTMSTEDFIEVLRRLIARRGRPKLIVSDNAKQFKLSDSILHKIWSNVVCDPSVQNYVASEGVQWKFIVQVAPWMGGFYERLISLVKRCLRKSVNSRLVTFRQLETVVFEIEAVINSRPLGFVGSELENSEILTPASFLGTAGRAGVPNIDINVEDPELLVKIGSTETLLKSWKTRQQIVDSFWKRFRNEYLLGLRERFYQNKLKNSVSNTPQIGQAVLIKDNLPRGQWRMGIIHELSHGLRSAIVRTPDNRKFHRAVRLLYPLELLETKEDQQPTKDLRRSTRLAATKATEAIKEHFCRGECRAIPR